MADHCRLALSYLQAQLLASAFSEASNLRAYQTFLQRRINSYLTDCSTRLRKDCICFVAVAEADGELTGDAFHQLTDV